MKSKIITLAVTCGLLTAIGQAAEQPPKAPGAPASKDGAADKQIQYPAVFVGKLERIEHSKAVGNSMPPHRVAKLIFTVEEVKQGKGLSVGQSLTIVDASMRHEPISYPLGKSYLVNTQGKQYGADKYTLKPLADKH